MALGKLILDLFEGFAELCNIRLGNSNTGVLDGDSEPAVSPRHLYVYPAVIACELHSV